MQREKRRRRSFGNRIRSKTKTEDSNNREGERERAINQAISGSKSSLNASKRSTALLLSFPQKIRKCHKNFLYYISYSSQTSGSPKFSRTCLTLCVYIQIERKREKRKKERHGDSRVYFNCKVR